MRANHFVTSSKFFFVPAWLSSSLLCTSRLYYCKTRSHAVHTGQKRTFLLPHFLPAGVTMSVCAAMLLWVHVAQWFKVWKPVSKVRRRCGTSVFRGKLDDNLLFPAPFEQRIDNQSCQIPETFFAQLKSHGATTSFGLLTLYLHCHVSFLLWYFGLVWLKMERTKDTSLLRALKALWHRHPKEDWLEAICFKDG